MSDYKILVPPPKRHGPAWIAGAIVIVALIVAGVVVITHHSQGSGHRATPPSGHSTTIAAPPLSVVSTTPATGATNVASDATVTVQLSAPITTVADLPPLNPPVPGAWKKTSAPVVTFAATAAFTPTSTESLTIPAGPTGLRDAAGGALAAPVTLSFTVAQASTERLQQLLAQGNYLPLSFTPTAPLSSPVEAFTSQLGTFAWRWPGTPPSLTSMWSGGSEDTTSQKGGHEIQNKKHH